MHTTEEPHVVRRMCRAMTWLGMADCVVLR